MERVDQMVSVDFGFEDPHHPPAPLKNVSALLKSLNVHCLTSFEYEVASDSQQGPRTSSLVHPFCPLLSLFARRGSPPHP